MKTTTSRNTTYSGLFAHEDVEHDCDICKRKIDVLTPKRNIRRKLNSTISKIKQCQEPWLSPHATNVNKKIFHTKACNFLDVLPYFEVQNECKYSKGKSNQASHASKTNIQ